ncbi:MAG: SGNH/GDSL hydrolase family protein [Xanthobacteraceae bacterium]
MGNCRTLWRGAALGVTALASAWGLTAVQAQSPGSIAAAGVMGSSTTTGPSPQASCVVLPQQARFDLPLPRLGRLLAAGKPIKIVALGSSSTAGAGASSSAASYPSRLADEFRRLLPGHEITVLNRGVNGEDASDMIARLDTAVIAEQPDLVLWQVGTNSVLRDQEVLPHARQLHEGLSRLKAAGAEVVLIDPQFAPKVIAKPNVDGMVSLIAAAAKADHVCLFHRFELMRGWHDAEHLPFEAFVSPDGLHMNDWSYGCLAKWLAFGIVEAATRPTATAGAPGLAR